MSRHDDILEAAAKLMETQGFHATGVNQILEASGAPKGSLYYYFPDGKDGLAEKAILARGRSIAENIRRHIADQPAAEAIPQFILTLSNYVAAAEYTAGGPITAIAMEVASTNERLNSACQEAYRAWQEAFADGLRQDGYAEDQAVQLAALIVAAIEGATVLARTERSLTPFVAVAEQIKMLLSLAR